VTLKPELDCLEVVCVFKLSVIFCIKGDDFVLDRQQLLDEQLRKLQIDGSAGDIEVLQTHLEKKATLELETNSRIQQNQEQREVITMCVLCSTSCRVVS